MCFPRTALQPNGCVWDVGGVGWGVIFLFHVLFYFQNDPQLELVSFFFPKVHCHERALYFKSTFFWVRCACM